MKKCCFIIVYFGKLPNYFQLFLNSCKNNIDYNWLLITDDKTNYNYPENVKVVISTFEETRKHFQSKFDFKISMNAPYKLCDYKPAYGYVYEEYINDFMFWGYCDIDMILGKISNFITNDMLEKYDKMFCLGHFVMFKNTTENNRLFMSEIDNELWYKDVYTCDKNLIFDENYCNEKNIHDIFLKKNKNVYENDFSLNFKVLPTNFIKIKFDTKSRKFIEDVKKSLYVFENGYIKRYYKENNKIFTEEYMYCHLQERKMKFKEDILNKIKYKIIPNYFVAVNYDKIDINNIEKISRGKLCFHFFQYHYKWKKKRIKEIIKKIGGK